MSCQCQEVLRMGGVSFYDFDEYQCQLDEGHQGPHCWRREIYSGGEVMLIWIREGKLSIDPSYSGTDRDGAGVGE